MQKELNVFPDLKLVDKVDNSELNSVKVEKQKTSYELAYEEMQRQLKEMNFKVVEEAADKRAGFSVVKKEEQQVSKEQLEAEFADLSVLGFETKMFDLSTNTLATDYMARNIDRLYSFARTLQIDKSKAEDLVQDVLESILKAEKSGDGYQFSSDKATMITVGEFVKGRIKGYAKNKRYYVSEVSSIGHGETVITCAATPEETGDMDEMNAFRKQMKNASYEFDGYGNIENSESLREQLLFIESMDELHDFGIMKLLKNMDMFDKLLVGVKSHKYESMFDKVKQAVMTHTDLGEALQAVLEFAKDDRVRFESVLATI